MIGSRTGSTPAVALIETIRTMHQQTQAANAACGAAPAPSLGRFAPQARIERGVNARSRDARGMSRHLAIKRLLLRCPNQLPQMVTQLAK